MAELSTFHYALARMDTLKNGVGAKGGALTTVRTFFGGQGEGNTGVWWPDLRLAVVKVDERPPEGLSSSECLLPANETASRPLSCPDR